MSQMINPTVRPVTTDSARKTVTTPSSGAAAARRHTMVGGTGRVSITSPGVDVFVKSGDSSVDASSSDTDGWHKLVPMGADEIIVVGDATHVSVFANADATVYISEVS